MVTKFKFKTYDKYTPEELFEKYSSTSHSFVESKKWNIETYISFWDSYEETNKTFVDSHFKYRKDSRSLGRFAADVLECSQKERKDFEVWLNGHGTKYFKQLDCTPTGVDVTGKLVLERGTKLDFKKPDFQVAGNYVEYKTNKFDHIATYKLEDLKVYHEYESYILTDFYNKGKYSGYCLFTPQNLKNIIEDLASSKINSFPFGPFGYKPSIQFYTKRKIGKHYAIALEDYCSYININ